MTVPLKYWTLIFVFIASLAFGSPWGDGQYTLKGYTKKTPFNVAAPLSRGFVLAAENIDEPDLLIPGPHQILTIKADSGEFRGNDGVFVGKIFLKVTSDNSKHPKELFSFEATDLEDRLHLELNTMTLRSKTSKVKFQGHFFEGAAVHIDLIGRKILWTNGPIKDNSKVMRGRFTLKY